MLQEQAAVKTLLPLHSLHTKSCALNRKHVNGNRILARPLEVIKSGYEMSPHM